MKRPFQFTLQRLVESMDSNENLHYDSQPFYIFFLYFIPIDRARWNFSGPIPWYV